MSRKWLLSTATFTLTAGLLLLLYSSRRVAVAARVWPQGLVVGEPLRYIDSTASAHSWHWEFGQGNSSLAPRGEFYYAHAGTYKVRLTVDGEHQRLFTITVRAPLRRDSTIRLLAPSEGYEGEKLTFQTFGAPANKFSWKFGETKQIDSHEATVFYAYTKPGTYTVELTTDVTNRTMRKKITILPRYSSFVQPTDTTVEDILWRLRRIAKGQQVNQHYTYLLTHYLCNEASAPVVAGSAPPSDFYSYCMNLQFDPGWIIDAVAVETDTTTNCTAKLVVTQHKND
jgi:PKD repeat protein